MTTMTMTTRGKATKTKIQGRTIRAVLSASIFAAAALLVPAPSAAADETGSASAPASTPASAPTPTPTPTSAVATASIERLNTGLLSAMKGGKQLGFEGRAKALEPDIDVVFDLPGMAKAILGHESAKLSPEQSAAMTSAFRRFTVANYAAEFSGWGGERFEILGEREGSGGTRIVSTLIVLTGGAESVPIDYVLHETDGRWAVGDVLALGTISEVARRRSEYLSIVRKDGADALIAALDSKSSELASKKR